MKIVIPGGAGLVGQNLVIMLKEKGYNDLLVIDKHPTNVAIMRDLHPELDIIEANVSQKGSWCKSFKDVDVVLMLQAQIGGKFHQEFIDNNVTSTDVILETMAENNIKSLVHISSSVINSTANDWYIQTKTKQEGIVNDANLNTCVLRPTLMFGWFDRKHVGWLSRFIRKVPVFPIPGNGKYMRQPLYVRDFCSVIISAIEGKMTGIYNISGQEKIDYIDMIKLLKRATNASAMIMKIPYSLFYFLLWVWALFDKKPPFTTNQLEALVADDDFEVINWPSIFEVTSTPIEQAFVETFQDEKFSSIELKF
mgnify:CR=1 FL=1